jgi:hypothetical protein
MSKQYKRFTDTLVHLHSPLALDWLVVGLHVCFCIWILLYQTMILYTTPLGLLDAAVPSFCHQQMTWMPSDEAANDQVSSKDVSVGDSG